MRPRSAVPDPEFGSASFPEGGLHQSHVNIAISRTLGKLVWRHSARTFSPDSMCPTSEIVGRRALSAPDAQIVEMP